MLYKLNIKESNLVETKVEKLNKEEEKIDTASDFSDTGSDLGVD